ncbi:hypothetical protein IEQ34_020135 [Dendrobium chrysotoxum]|uniref:Uncharacterized protein n=1 Tax=Dendrobium chrysotoxum TaxID=161865 RepID=A0AAV7G149_DENCH|nr:hypothetical protein IEQ34_020135 [Dendrobium chrysotoxum]
MAMGNHQGYSWAVAAGLNAALATVSAKLFASLETPFLSFPLIISTLLIRQVYRISISLFEALISLHQVTNGGKGGGQHKLACVSFPSPLCLLGFSLPSRFWWLFALPMAAGWFPLAAFSFFPCCLGCWFASSVPSQLAGSVACCLGCWSAPSVPSQLAGYVACCLGCWSAPSVPSQLAGCCGLLPCFLC